MLVAMTYIFNIIVFCRKNEADTIYRNLIIQFVWRWHLWRYFRVKGVGVFDCQEPERFQILCCYFFSLYFLLFFDTLFFKACIDSKSCIIDFFTCAFLNLFIYLIVKISQTLLIIFRFKILILFFAMVSKQILVLNFCIEIYVGLIFVNILCSKKSCLVEDILRFNI